MTLAIAACQVPREKAQNLRLMEIGNWQLGNEMEGRTR
jgi:hypothetical protein